DPPYHSRQARKSQQHKRRKWQQFFVRLTQHARYMQHLLVLYRIQVVIDRLVESFKAVESVTLPALAASMCGWSAARRSFDSILASACAHSSAGLNLQR